MKKIFLYLLAFVALPALADVPSWTPFDFSDPLSLNIQPALSVVDQIALKEAGDVVTLTNKTILSDEVTMSFGYGEGHEGAAINHYAPDSDPTVSTYSLSMLMVRR